MSAGMQTNNKPFTLRSNNGDVVDYVKQLDKNLIQLWNAHNNTRNEFFKLKKTVDNSEINHSKLQNLNSTNYTHLTEAQADDLTDGGTTTLHTHDYSIVSGLPSTFTPSLHNILNATYHGDAETGSITRGDILYGNSTPKISRLAKGASGSLLTTDASDIKWDTISGIGIAPAFTNSNPVTYSANVVGLGYNTTNLKITATQLDTIQSIATGAVPTFAGLIAAYIKPSADSTTAIQLQKANGTMVLNVDTTNSRIGIGITAPLTTLDISGSISVPSGTVTDIPYRFHNDQNTGIYNPFADSFGFVTGGVEIFRVDGGNVIYRMKSNLIIGWDDGVVGEPFNTGLHRVKAGMVGVGTWDNTGLLTCAGIGVGTTLPTAKIHIVAGSNTAGTAPLKFTSGPLTTVAEAGAMEFLTDDLYFTITTGAARKGVLLNNGTSLTSGRVPYSTTNGRLTDSSNLTFDGTDLSIATAIVVVPNNFVSYNDELVIFNDNVITL